MNQTLRSAGQNSGNLMLTAAMVGTEAAAVGSTTGQVSGSNISIGQSVQHSVEVTNVDVLLSYANK